MQTSYLRTKAVGVLAMEPKSFNASTGMAGLSGSLAIRRFYVDKDNNPQTTITYIDWEYWYNKESEKEFNFKKGDYLEVEGEVYEKSWDTPTGEKRRKHFIKAKSVAKSEE